MGFLSGQSSDTFAHVAVALRQGLNDTGCVEGQKIAIEYR
jgi:hypothetical protein